MNRQALDAFAAHYQLSAAATQRALAHVQPDSNEVESLYQRVLYVGGVLSLIAGILFFIAANWDALGILGHFALLQSAFVASVTVAWWRPPFQLTGRLALLAAFVLTGGLLALFGQTYQTGADVYELFFTWTVLGLPLVVAGRWGATWAAWLVVFNTALVLFCGWVPGQGVLWLVLNRWGFTESRILLLPMLINLVLWWISGRGTSSYVGAAVPSWVRQLAVAYAMVYATWAGIYSIVGVHWLYGRQPANEGLTWFVLFASLGAMCVYTYLRRRDALPLMGAAGCLIVLGTVAIADAMNDFDIGVFFAMTLWLVVTSTLAGRWLTSLHRAWRGTAQLTETQL